MLPSSAVVVASPLPAPEPEPEPEPTAAAQPTLAVPPYVGKNRKKKKARAKKEAKKEAQRQNLESFGPVDDTAGDTVASGGPGTRQPQPQPPQDEIGHARSLLGLVGGDFTRAVEWLLAASKQP